jgi:hypothetical protein
MDRNLLHAAIRFEFFFPCGIHDKELVKKIQCQIPKGTKFQSNIHTTQFETWHIWHGVMGVVAKVSLGITVN